jgi:hypothetical protein
LNVESCSGVWGSKIKCREGERERERCDDGSSLRTSIFSNLLCHFLLHIHTHNLKAICIFCSKSCMETTTLFLCKIPPQNWVLCVNRLCYFSLFYADKNGNSDFHTLVLITHTHALSMRREKGVNCSFLHTESAMSRKFTLFWWSIVKIDYATWKMLEIRKFVLWVKFLWDFLETDSIK